MLFRFEETPFWVSQVTKVEEPCPALTGPTSDFSRHHHFAEMQGLKARILASFAVLSLVYCGVVSIFLSLERVYPPNHRVQIEQLRARDRVRHARLLQNVASGVVNFPVHGSSEPNLAG
ncbi:hypothetical protein CerSpe_238020 [Prunus speciosa]